MECFDCKYKFKDHMLLNCYINKEIKIICIGCLKGELDMITAFNDDDIHDLEERIINLETSLIKRFFNGLFHFYTK